MNALFRKAFLTACLLWLSVTSLHGQAITGSISGSVHDSTGAAIPNATVTAINADTGISQTAKSGDDGNYTVPNLAPGTYTLTADFPGFNTAVVNKCIVHVEETLRIDMSLKIGSVQTTVAVDAAPETVQTTSSDLGVVVGSKEAEALPLNGRLFEQLIMIVPGAVPAQYGNTDQSENPAASGSVGPQNAAVNGLPWAGDYYMIDGVHDSEPGNGYVTITPPLDSIQEFKVETANPQAEYGAFGGAIINVTSKSGTNSFHGEVFEFLRNTALNANDYFAQSKLPYHSNQFGAMLGGPIRPNKLFFFLDYQQLLLNQGQPYLISVPTQDMRNGILNEPGQTQAYDPATGQPFANNIIPANEINPIAQQVANLYPLPNLPGIFNNYAVNEVNTENVPQFDVRVDWQISASDHVFAKESYSSRAFTSPSPGNVFMYGGPYSNSANHTPVIGWNHIFSPNAINDLRIGYMRFYLTEFANSYGIDKNNEIGLPNGNLPQYPDTSGLAYFNIAGYYQTGDPGYVNSLHDTNIYDLTDGLTLIKGNHALKFGADLQRSSFTDTNPQDDPRGIFNFDGNVTSDQGNYAGNPFASFLLGYPASVVRDLVLETPRVITWYVGPYAQDDWKVNQHLTINYGLRWDLFTHPVEAFNKQSNFNLATGQLQFASSSNRGPNVDNVYTHFGPRFGFAYTPNAGTTAIRGAFGLSYFNDVFGANGGTLERNYPFFPVTNLVTPNPFTPFYSLNQGLPVPQSTPYQAGALFTPPPGTNVFEMDRNFQVDQAEVWNVNLQQQFTKGLGLTLAYVGTHGVHLFRDLQLNQAVPGPGNLPQTLPFYNIAPNVQNVDARNGNGSSRYNGLQAKLEGHYANGLYLLASYTWSKDIDDVSYILYPYIDRLNRGLSANDMRNVFNLSYAYELPLGRGKRFLNNRPIISEAVGGWSINGITSIHSGYPEILYVASSTLNNNGPFNTPNLTCPRVSYPKQVNEWFNTNCFTNPALYTFGNSGTAPVTAPGVNNWDVSLAKETKIREGTQLRIEGNFFNIANNPHFGVPNQTYGTAGFGTITSDALPPRIIQLGAKLSF